MGVCGRRETVTQALFVGLRGRHAADELPDLFRQVWVAILERPAGCRVPTLHYRAARLLKLLRASDRRSPVAMSCLRHLLKARLIVGR